MKKSQISDILSMTEGRCAEDVARLADALEALAATSVGPAVGASVPFLGNVDGAGNKVFGHGLKDPVEPYALSG